MFMRVSVELHLNVEDCYLSISVEHWPLIGVRTTQTARRKKVFQEMASGADQAPIVTGAKPREPAPVRPADRHHVETPGLTINPYPNQTQRPFHS